MTTRHAACACGRLKVETTGEPVRISICHCLDCQRRTGSAFGAQARFPSANVAIDGPYKEHVRTADSGAQATQCFCPTCGSTVFWPSLPGFTSVAIGAFADPGFPAPTVSVYDERRHDWARLAGDASMTHE
ncbi:MAG: GFA family protein [Parvularculaceae bacterium]